MCSCIPSRTVLRNRLEKVVGLNLQDKVPRSLLLEY